MKGVTRLTIPVFCFLFFNLVSQTLAQTNTSTGLFWNNAASWSLGHIPLPAEDVVINTNMTMDMPSASFTINSLTVNNTRTLTLGVATAQTIVVTSGVTTIGSGAINLGAANLIHSLSIGGNLSNAGTLTLWASATRACNVTLSGSTISGNGTYTLAGLTVQQPLSNNSTSTINIRGDLTTNATFTSTTGTIAFNGGIAQNVNGTTNPTFNNFSIATNGTNVVLGGITGINVNGTFTMANTTTFNFGSGSARAVTIVGNLVTPQTITMTGAGLAHQLLLGGAANAAPATFNTTAGSGSTVEYNGGSQSVFNSANYRILKLAGTGLKTFSGATTVNNDLEITGNGITVVNANALGINGDLNSRGSGITQWGGTANTTTVTGKLLITDNSTFSLGDRAANKTLQAGTVQVDAGSTLNVSSFAAIHGLTINSDLQVNGTLNMVQTFPTNVCNVTFSGATSNTVTGLGTINFNQITLTKGAIANVLEVLAPISMSSPTAAGTFLTLTSGTFKLSSASTLTPYFGNATICAGIGSLWLNNALANVSCVQTNTSANPGTPTVTGLLRLTAGTFSYGSGNDVMTANAATSHIWVEGGTLNMYGAVSFTSTSQFTMTSGAMNVSPQGFDNLAAGTSVVNFGSTNATSAVAFTGGALTIVDPPIVGAGGNALTVTNSAAGVYNFNGGTINFGDGLSSKNGLAGVGFAVDGGGVHALGTVVLNNGTSTGLNRTMRLLTRDCIIRTSLIIGNNTNDNLLLNGRTLTLNGTLSVGTGTITGSATSSLSIGGSNTPTMSLPPISGGLLNLTLNKTGTNNTVILGGSTTLAGVLTLTSGILEIGNFNLTLSNNAAAAIAGTPFSNGNMISTNGTGYLVKNVASAQALNPIGAGGYYSPMTLSSMTAGGTYSIRAVPTSLNPNFINVYWDLVTSAAGKTITATFQYDPLQLNGASQIISYLPAPYTQIQRPPLSGTSTFGSNTFTITGNTTATNGGYWTMGNNGTYYSYQTGNWNSPTTWTSDPSGTLQIGTTIPSNDDEVVILTGRTVTLTSNVSTQLMNITINSSAFLDMSTFSFTTGLSSLEGDGTLRLASANFPTIVTNNFVNTGGGTVEYYNSSSFTLPITQTTYNNLTINATGQIATQLNNLTLNGNLLIKSGTLQINDNTSARRQLTIAGNLTVNSGGAIRVGTGVTNTVTDPTSITTTIAGPFIDYYDSHSHRVVINGDFINNGTVNFSNLPYPIYNAFPPMTLGATTGFATVYFRGSSNSLLTCNNTSNFYNIVVDKGTDQTYSLTLNASAYSNFKLFGANNAAADALMGATATNPNVKKALWIRNGTLIVQGSTVLPSLSEGNITAALPATSDYFIPANGALVINGPDVVVMGTADDYREVNTSYSVSGGAGLVNGVILGGTSALYVYGKLQVNDGYLSMRESGGIVTNGGSGQIVIAGGIVDAKQFLNGTASTASFQISGGVFALRGRFQRTPATYATMAGLTDNSTASLNTARALNGTTTGFGTFSINNTANIFNMSGGNIIIYDVCDAAPPATAEFAFDVKSATSNISVTGGTITLAPTTGSVLADETAFLISSTASLANLTINRASGASIVRLNTGFPLTVLNAFDIQSGSFDANAQNVTIGGNFSIASAGSYLATGTSSNTTTLNGSTTQVLTVNTAAALNLNNVTFTKTAGVAVNFAGSQKTVNIAGSLTLTLGTLNDNGNSIIVAGNVLNSGVHAGTGRIVLNGSASTQTIDGNGVFQNLELNNTNASAAPVALANNITINGMLTFSQPKIFNIGIYNLRLNASASIVNADATRYMQSAGNVGDGGITKVYASSAAFVFPIGAQSTSHVGVPNFTPVSIGLTGTPTSYGSITVVPVGYAHPNATTAGRSLSYFWRVRSSGFVLGSATVTHGYTYSANDVITGAGISENEYVAARYDVNSTTWTRGTVADLDIVAKVIGQPAPGSFLKNVSFIDGDYTAGDDNPINPFGVPKVFYSFASGVWGAATSWTSDPTRATWVNIGTPAATDVVHIGAGHTISFGTPANYLTTPNTDPRYCATLYIDAGSVLDVRYNPASNLGIVMNSPLGNGTIRITTAQASGSTFANPAGDFSSFNTNLGTTDLYSTNPAAGTTYWMANGVTTYGNLLFSPLGGSNIIFPNNDVLIYGNCTETGANADSWLCPSWSGAYPQAPTVTVAKTITINGNLDIQGGSFIWYGNGAVAQNVVVNGNVTVCATCGLGYYDNTAQNQTMTIGGTLTNNANGTNNGVTTVAKTDFTNIPVIFNGNTSASITNTVGTPLTIFSTVTVNKGTSQATTLNLNIAGTLTTPTNNWLTLQNGTLQYQRTNPATNFTISTTTNLSIPSTAGLYINYANGNNTNVLIANSGADASDLLLSGKLTLVSGNVYVGPTGATAFNNDIEYSGNSAAIQVDGGNLFVNGQIRRSTSSTNGALSYIQNGGTVTINGNSSAAGAPVAATRAKLEVLNTGSQFNMTAGNLNIIRGGGTTFGDLYIRPAASTVTGGTITFTNAVPNTLQNYTLDANTPLNNLTITGAAATNATLTLMTNDLTLKGTLTLSNIRSFFNTNNRNITIQQNLVNNAATANYIFGTSRTTFAGSVQNISGSATTNFYDLTVSPSVTLSVNSNFTVNRHLTIGSGNLVLGAYKVTVLTSGDFVNNGAYTDDNITGGVALAGNAQQEVSGTGSFNRLEINNSAGALLLNSITLDHDLVMTSGIFNIQSYNLILNTGASISGSAFSSAKMIMTDGVATSAGLRKFFPVIGSTTTFTYPVGVPSKYTPAVYTINANGSIGYINVVPVNSYQPTVLDATRVLDYYFSISSSGLTGFDGRVDLTYLAADVRGTESDYVAAWLQLPGTYWSKAAVGSGTDNVNETLHQIRFTYPAGTTNLNGDYTAGEDPAIPNQIPTYISNSDGNWNDNTIWTPVGSSPPCPIGGPNGYNVIVQHNVSTAVNNCFAYTTIIQGSGTLSVVSPTFGHNFGTVTGDDVLGTGKIYLEAGNLPAGNFTSFLDCGQNGTIEFGGAGTYTIILNGFTTIPNLTFSGTGTRVLPANDLTICNTLLINGPTLDNSVSNRKLTIQGSMQRLGSGAFLSGSGATATVSFAGTALQTLGGAIGNFSGANAFNNLEINNSAGLAIGSGGNIAVNGNLFLTQGIVTTTTTNTLTLLNTSSTAVVPTGGTTSSFVNGPLTKQIINGESFVYPLGTGSTKGHTFTLTSTSSGSSLFTAQYFTPNPTWNSVSAPLVHMNQLEYWSVNSTGSKTAKVKIAWDSQSDINGTMTQNGIADIQVAEYSTASSSWVGLTSVTSGTNNLGDAVTSNSVNIAVVAKNYSLGSTTTTIPIAVLSPTGPVCGVAGIPVTIRTHSAISLNYTISYTYNGVAQTPIVVTSLPFTLPTPAPGDYQLTGFTYNNSTLTGVVDPTIVTDYASPTTSVAGPNQSICNATSLNLTGNQPTVGTGLWTIVSGNGGWFNTPDATNYNALFGGPPGNTYTLRWTITNGACTSSSNVTISFPYTPLQPSPFTAAPSSVCKGSSAVYTVPPVSSATSYVWSYSGSGASFSGSSNSVTVTFSPTSTNGTLGVSAVNGCGTGAARSVAVTAVAPAVATFSYTGGSYCPNATNPTPTFSGGGVAGTFSSTTGLLFVNTSTGEVNLSGSTPGTYTVTNTIPAAAPCGIITATNTITVYGLGSWLGTASSDWLNPNNWNCVAIPNSASNVNIPIGTPFMPVIGAPGAVARDVVVNAGATLTITGTNTLDVYRNFTNNGTFTPNSSTISFNGNGAISGNPISFFNVAIAPSANVTTSANIAVMGDWANQGTFTASGGTVTFAGGTNKSVSGTNAFNSLRIIKPGGTLTLSGTGATTVSNVLTLTNGNIISSSANMLSLAAAATVTGGSSTSFVSGSMRKVITSGSFTFPLGSNSAARYRPAVISNPTGSDTWTAEYFPSDPTSAGYSSTAMNQANIGTVSAFEYWSITRSGSANADLGLSYDVGSYTPPDIGNTAELRVARWGGAQWDLPPGASSFTQSGNNISGTSTATAISSFGVFTHASIGSNSPLPIRLLYFRAKSVDDGILTEWSTAYEKNNDYYTLQKSIDGETFFTVTVVDGARDTYQQTKYSFKDIYPYSGLSYYRLKQTDIDGTFTYSNVIAVNFEGRISFRLRTYPNPNRGDRFAIEITGTGEAKELPLQIYDLHGKKVLDEVLTVETPGFINKEFVFPKPLSSGVYIIKSGRTLQATEKLIVE